MLVLSRGARGLSDASSTGNPSHQRTLITTTLYGGLEETLCLLREGDPSFPFQAAVPRSGADGSNLLAVATCLLPAKTVSRERGEK